MKKLRVMIVDDSTLIRQIISDIVNAQPDMEAAGIARNGMEATRICRIIRPDVITMDLEMPGKNGLWAVKEIMAEGPIPIIMVSSHTREGSQSAFEALASGAVDFVPKPSYGRRKEVLEELRRTLPIKIRAAANARMDLVSETVLHKHFHSEKNTALRKRREAKVVVAMGASTGGPRALEKIISGLPEELPAAILVTQHMPAGFTSSLARRLDIFSSLNVKEARNKDSILDGEVLIAPGGHHLKVHKGEAVLDSGPPVNHVRPAVDVMIESLIGEPYAIITVILTGMGRDGAAAIKKMKDSGKRMVSIVQDPLTAVVSSMPVSVLESGHHIIVPLSDIASEIVRWSGNLNREVHC